MLVAAVAALLLLLALRTTPAPQVTFVSLAGERITTAPLKSKVMVVNFWATDCPVCVREMPELAATYEKYGARGLELVAVAMRHDPPSYVIRFAEANRLPFKVALDSLGEHAKAFGGVRLTPTTFVVDRHGNIAERIVGRPDFGRLNALIEEKLRD
jgi:peroxiredoxin